MLQVPFLQYFKLKNIIHPEFYNLGMYADVIFGDSLQPLDMQIYLYIVVTEVTHKTTISICISCL